MSDAQVDRAWWKEAVVYQIYPRSFNDSDGDGVGDIPGIIEKLDYLEELGVDVVWLSPVYESPDVDNGYDIADYRAIMDEFGTMDDWEALLDGLHERGIRLVMDLVVNHTSDEHAWFVNSRDVESDYHDWYFWREGRTDVEGFTGHEGPADEAPPNEWESFFGGPAWAYDESVGKWYLHLFDRKQPDLNWENEAVRDAVFEMMEWWLEKGIDGFRMDVINLVSKPESVTAHDPPLNDVDIGGTIDGPRVHEYVRELYDRVLDGRDLLTVGEMIGSPLPMDEARRYVTEDGLCMVFHFEHVLLDRGGRLWETAEWELDDLRRVFTRWQEGLADGGWNSLYLSNHDQPRLVSRYGDDGPHRRESAKLLATLLFTLRGTPYIYQGAELGMTNYPFESLDEFRDVETVNHVRTALETDELSSVEEALPGLRANSRDNGRTPVQWTDGPNAGFTDGEPWIGVNPNKAEINAEAAREDPDSVWHYYRELIRTRKEHDVLVYGDYDLRLPDHETVWAYVRELGDERAFVALNFASVESTVAVPADVDLAGAEPLLRNYGDAPSADPSEEELALRPWEARVYLL